MEINKNQKKKKKKKKLLQKYKLSSMFRLIVKYLYQCIHNTLKHKRVLFNFMLKSTKSLLETQTNIYIYIYLKPLFFLFYQKYYRNIFFHTCRYFILLNKTNNIVIIHY